MNIEYPFGTARSQTIDHAMKIFFFYDYNHKLRPSRDIPFKRTTPVPQSYMMAIISENSTWDEYPDELRGCYRELISPHMRALGHREVVSELGFYLRNIFHADREKYNQLIQNLDTLIEKFDRISIME